MKYTIETDRIVGIVNSALEEMKSIYDSNTTFIYIDEPDIIIRELKEIWKLTEKINTEHIRREFWESCDSYDKILSNMHLFEVKFDKLLSSKFDYYSDFKSSYLLAEQDLNSFYFKQAMRGVFLEKDEKEKINDIYLNLSINIHSIKGIIKLFLKEWEAMGTPFSEPIVSKSNINCKTDLIPQNSLPEADITLNRQFLALYYLLNEADKQIFARNKSEIARFIQLLTGKNYDNIYKLTKNPIKDPSERTSKKYQSDIQFVKESFLKLNLNKIAQQIENDNLIG